MEKSYDAILKKRRNWALRDLCQLAIADALLDGKPGVYRTP